MHTTLIFLLAAGHLASAQESLFSYSPRETTTDDNLATITTLSDGHLPTCFTNHPTHPCPTNGADAKRDLVQDLNRAARMAPIDPMSMTVGDTSNSLPTDTPEAAVIERDAPLTVANKDYIPRPSEWLVPANFTFTDTISQNTTGTSATAAGLNTTSSTSAAVTATPHSDSYLKSESNYFSSEDTYAKRMNVTAMIESIKHEYMAPFATGAAAAHTVVPIEDALLQSSNATSTATLSAGHGSVSVATMSSVTGQITPMSSASNTSSSVHMEGTIGTLLSAAMFPGKMRVPTTSSSQASAPVTTLAPSVPEHSIVPIPMSQRPNTTAPNDSFQAFVHTINTETTATSQHTSSSISILPASASATPITHLMEEVKPDHVLAASSSETAHNAAEASVVPTVETGKPKTGEKLHHYLHSIALKKPSATHAQEVPTASSSASPSETILIANVNHNDTQAITRINSNDAATLSQALPIATPTAIAAPAHHHPRARRFIS
jgi:hypothetical protein